jgi:glycosyltransferase involved in cell wall biosynthesis
MLERAELAKYAIGLSDRVIFLSELEYNLFYRTLIPEEKTLFLEQGIFCDGTFENRPFEIEGAVKFGFMGEIIPEDGILDLVKAFNALYDDGFMNEVHIYGELYENSPYFSRLNRKVRNPNTYFHGPIEPGRINSVLNTFDVLIIPSKWHRSDTFLLNSAVISRKAIICSSRHIVAEKVRKYARGLILDEIIPEKLYNAVSELERNRKRLYYFMRVTNDFNTPEIKDNMNKLVETYSKFKTDNIKESQLLLQKKLNRRKTERHRG